MLPVFREHREPIMGRIIDIKITEHGIKVAAGVWTDVQQRSFSFGFNLLNYSYKKVGENGNKKIRILERINIKEISFVFFPAQEGTQCKKKI